MDSELWQKDREVMEFVASHHDCSISDIIHGVDNFTEHTIRGTVKHLVRTKRLKQKEDPIDHDWVYRVWVKQALGEGEESDA